MGRARTMMLMVGFGVLAAPQSAMAATTEAVTVPDWLSMAAGIVGLIVAVGLLVDAVLLRRVSEGSMIAENILYMMLAVVCFGASMLTRFLLQLDQFQEVKELVTLAADLLMTAGMALLTLYFYRVRTAMTRYLQSAKAYQAAATNKDEGDASA